MVNDDVRGVEKAESALPGEGQAMQCPECGEVVTHKQFAIVGRDTVYDMSFACPKCRYKCKETFAAETWPNAEDLAIQMLIARGVVL